MTDPNLVSPFLAAVALGEVVKVEQIVGAVLYSILGVVILVLSFYVIDKITPGHLWKEILEDKNTALAILMGAAAIGVSLIIASAIK